MKFHLFFILTLFSITNASALTYERRSLGWWTSAHILIVDPHEHAIIPVKASVGRESLLTLAREHEAVAGVNGGFWKLSGSPAGILKIDGHWYGTPVKPRAAIGWSLGGLKVGIDRLLTNMSLDEAIDEGDIEVLPLSDTHDWQEFDHIVGGTPLLIQNGLLVTDYSSEQTIPTFLSRRHPRTAVGIREDGQWVFVVVDGRFYGALGGMTIPELGEFMLSLGCVSALNLDGGGSSTMALDGKVVSDPCGSELEEGKWVQRLSDAILILPI